MAGCAVSRMKAHWFYLIHRFEGSEALEKQLRKAREGWEYEVVVNQIFTLPLFAASGRGERFIKQKPAASCETAE